MQNITGKNHRRRTGKQLRRWLAAGTAFAALSALALVTGSGSAQAASLTVNPTADTWVVGAQPTTNFGSKSYFAVRGAQEVGLLSFNVAVPAGTRVQSATLWMNSGNATGQGVSIYSTKAGWSETGVSYANAPARGTLLATCGVYAAHSWVGWNVSQGVSAAGGSVNLRVENASSTWMGFMSRESGATAPKLVITTSANSADSTESATSTGSVSGASIPVGDLASWKQVFRDDFNGTSLASGWGKYAGPIPSMPGGLWSESHVTVANGTLQLLGSKVGGVWTTGGVMNYVQAQTTYGKYEVRFRMAKANGVKYALLLWPSSGRWPQDGEIDFAEDGGGLRASTTATVHWGSSVSTKVQVQRRLTTDFSAWHTVGVEWTPSQLIYTVDGAEWGRVNNANIPHTPMNLALQTEAGSCNEWMTCVDATTPSEVPLQVDWVAVYTHK